MMECRELTSDFGGLVAEPEEPIKAAIESTIRSMHADAQCEEGIGGLATGVFYSKFHFSREFRRLTGTTPRRFLSAVRLNEAKRRLIVEDSGIAFVCNVVGYSSVGTFSTRFTELVGASPRAWRSHGGVLDPLEPGPGLGPYSAQGRVFISGEFADVAGPVFVGAYPDHVLQGPPAAFVRVWPGEVFRLEGLPPGRWSIIATASAPTGVVPSGDSSELVGYAFIEVSARPQRRALRLELHPRTVLDPPTVFARTGVCAARSPELVGLTR